ncbi:hypothetical protein TYRP_004157, partial [Tyrophagus putrescentiae]
PNK